MSDPHKDLAEIIEPAAPPAPAVPSSHAMAWTLAATLILALVLGWRWWRGGARVRALRRLVRINDLPTAAANLARLAPATAMPEAWRQDLERLRYARPTPDAAATLARLCGEAAQTRSPR
jgi:hypothetical protein